MNIHTEELSDITRYLENHKHFTLGDSAGDFDLIMGRIRRFKEVDETSKLFEVGVETGWLTTLCKRSGISCKGMDISPQLVENACEFSLRHGVEPEIVLGNIEVDAIGDREYDVIIATSTFEHVERWRDGIQKIFDPLKPGGLFYFYSTNKFSIFKSHEYNFPLYGWLPDRMRYRLRVWRQGEDIMKLGIDFNQFTHGRLRRTFGEIGFSETYDRLDVFCRYRSDCSARMKFGILNLVGAIPPLKELALLFSSGTLFICIK